MRETKKVKEGHKGGRRKQKGDPSETRQREQRQVTRDFRVRPKGRRGVERTTHNSECCAEQCHVAKVEGSLEHPIHSSKQIIINVNKKDK